MKQTKNVNDEHAFATMKAQTGPEVKIFAQGVLVLFFTESSLVTFVSRPQLF
jgi:hypothetical protein